ncbi:MAG: pyridoxamine 5'-phosphate oxidase family protein [Chloroflexi bacterium]|nr:pyridoxamine 5'-phosphate oxidase family protein [Chloroflexota bacterium]
MGKVFDGIDDALRVWINKQHIFFVSTAPLSADGLVNCSSKGYDCFRILNEREVAYLDLTGSGIETVAHVQENGRIVFMFCSFDQTPRIVRLHGKGFVHANGTPEFETLLKHFEPRPAMRSIIRVELTRISDSCGYGVPRYEFVGDRETLVKDWDAKGAAAALEYQRTRNATSLDGLPGLR